MHVPMATYESPLWPSTDRGAKVSQLAGGIYTAVGSDCMTRSITVQAANGEVAHKLLKEIEKNQQEIAKVVQATSNYARFRSLTGEQVGRLLYLRLSIQPGDASGHNMTTKAADALMQYLLKQYPALEYVSISGNACTDKKVSAINGLLGRGKHVMADITIPAAICQQVLRIEPAQLVALNIKKNLVGSTLAGSLRSANAHYANALLAIYLATGQDAANIIEASQGITYAEVVEDSLYFSVTMPNIIVGTVGNGKHLSTAQKHLADMGCLSSKTPGESSRRLAAIIAASVLCSELSLLAAQCNPGELMRAHHILERQSKQTA